LKDPNGQKRAPGESRTPGARSLASAARMQAARMLAALLLSLACLAAAPGPAPAEPPLSVFVTIEPQAFFVERIGGPRVVVHVLVGGGQCAETYEPTPKQLARLAASRAYFAVGMPMETALLPRIRSGFRSVEVIDTAEGIRRRSFEHDFAPEEPVQRDGDASRHDGGAAQHDGDASRHDGDASHHDGDASHHDEGTAQRDEGTAQHDGHRSHQDGDEAHQDGDTAHDGSTARNSPEAAHHHDHAGVDPHIWLNPRLARQMSANIAAGLARLDPAHQEEFRARQAALDRELETLDGDLAAILAPVRGRVLLAYHPSYGYLADAYGLRQLAIELEGFKPGSKQLARVVEQARAAATRAIFVQEGSSTDSAEIVAREIGASVVALDPMTRDYLEGMRRLATRVRDGILEGKGP